MFSVADQFEGKLKTATLRIENLASSVLSKAFRGELVPQGPNDEPSDVLLNRIRAEREALAANKRKVDERQIRDLGEGKDRNHKRQMLRLNQSLQLRCRWKRATMKKKIEKLN